MLPIWLLAMMIMMYYWRFWEPWANAMLAILLPKLWFGLTIMTGTTVFACLPGAHPYWTQKSFKTNSFTYIIDWIRKKLLILQHCLACPSWQTMRSWISLYKRMCVVCAPQPLCKGILRCYCIQKIQKMLCHYCYTWMSCLTRCFPSEPKICSRSLADLLQGKTCITNSFLLIRLHFSDILFFTLAE